MSWIKHCIGLAWFLTSACASSHGAVVDAPRYAIRTRMMTATSGAPIPIAIWYPVTRPATLTAEPTAPGRFPLILISHGSGGSERNQQAWAEYLAMNGYVVAAPRHWGDSYDKPRGQATDVQLVGRPLQAQAAIHTVLADPVLRPLIDPGRIGMVGYSAGGYTTLVMAGAKPDFTRWKAHCRAHAAEDAEFCPAITWRLLPIITRTNWPVLRPTRIKAAVVMAPVSFLFDKAGLRNVTIPLKLFGAQHDEVAHNAWNVGHLAESLPTPAPVTIVAGGHYVFLGPCSARMQVRLPLLCITEPGVDRAATQRQISIELVTFFDRHL